MNKSEYTTIIREAVLHGNISEIEKLLKHKGGSPGDAGAVLAALASGVEGARMKLIGGAISIPEFLLCIDAFKAGASLVKKGAAPDRGVPVFIGVVEGDVHDLGKNIVAAVLGSCGYSVTDMGKDVTREMIRRYCAGRKKAVVALSSMMSTSLGPMKDIVEWLGEVGPGIKSLVGGAALDPAIARSIGADGYAESAATAPDELRRILSTLK